MNILVIAHSQNGSTPTAIFIHNQVVEYKRLGHNVMVVSSVPILKRDFYGSRISCRIRISNIDGVKYVFFRFLSFSKYGIWGRNAKNAIRSINGRLKKEITDFLPDVIHAHTIGFESEIGAWLKETYNKPLVVTVHGSDVEIPIEKNKTDLMNIWCRKADVIVTVSTKLRERLKKNGVNNNIETILNGYQKKSGKRTDKRRHTLMQVGSLIKSKHYEITIRAFKAYQKIYNDASLTIIGEGEQKDYLKKICRDLDIEKSVVFWGHLDNEEVLGKMGETEYFIMPSFPEGFGIVYLEAMASRCITIGTEGEGIADLIRDGENGFLVQANSVDEIVKKLLWCEVNYEKAEKIREEAYLSVEYLNWTENARKYIRLFNGLINKRNEINL